ncbi:MAG: formylglycine-generating enzyme family protein [Chloroflexi bacterium]|nr:formylglycine-generating enzyme family protein [Chloroflexota bacterium]
MTLLASCAPVEVSAPAPTIRVNADTSKWASIPAGEFHHGQFNEMATINYDYEMMVYLEMATINYDYEMMVYLVTNQQYAAFINAALAEGGIKIDGDKIAGFYSGDEFHGVKHEERIEAGDWIYIPLNDPSLRLNSDGRTFTVQSSWEWHPMTMVSWFGAQAYCEYYGWRLPTEMEWEKAARGTDERPFPWGDEILRENANFYASRDPFEDMSSFGSRTSPVGFYNGNVYDGFQTVNSASPYGLYDMAGNVWQWTGDVYEGMHYRFMRGGSKDTYDMDLRLWVRNNATPTYFSPGVGFRCAR